jgi:hypothetical protein
MSVALLVIGVLFLTAAVRGKQDLLFDTLKDDFTGPNNFIIWGLAVFLVSAVGYYRPLKPLSNAFLVLVFVVLFLSHRGFIEKFMAQIRSGSSGGGSFPNFSI